MRLINADALIKFFKENSNGDYTEWFLDNIEDAIKYAPTIQRDGWVSVDDRLPEIKDDSVLAHFENGSIESVHIQDYFKPITNGFDDDGNQIYTLWYLHSAPIVTHWQPLPAAPTDKE